MDLKKAKPAQSRARKYGPKDVQYLNEEELAALFRCIDGARDFAIFELAFHRGLRATEVGMLKAEELRLSVRRLNIRRLKNGNSGEYVLTDREVRALKKWMAVRGYGPGPLFPSRQHGPISRGRLDQLMKYYGRRAGLPESKRHFHCLRHSAGTLLAERAAVEEVQDHLGHVDIRSTMRYVKVRGKRRDELGERMAKEW